MTEDEHQQAMNEQRRLELSQAYKRVAVTDDGKEVFDDLKYFCGQDCSSVRDKPIDPYQVVYFEGQRRVYLRINSMITRKEMKDENSGGL